VPPPRFRHRVEHAAVATVTRLARGVPQNVALAGGRFLGRTFYALDSSRRRLTIDNLAAALPNLSPDERRQVAKQVFEHFGGLLVELLRVSGLRPEELRALVEIEGEERLRHALAQGRGVLLVSGHFGFWEIQGIAHALVFPPMAVVARALDNPLLDRLLERVRTRTGNVVIERRGGLRRILRALAANQCVAIMIDQHIHTDAVVVDFFNRPAATTSAVAAIALRTGAPVIPVFAVPFPDGRYRLIYEHAVAPPPADSEDPVREFTQRCTDVLEMYVRRYPQLWLWMHRRWRHPEAEGAT
jgi:Kdo2-lipid IVA lauroyltransferase/acyltransferase